MISMVKCSTAPSIHLEALLHNTDHKHSAHHYQVQRMALPGSRYLARSPRIPRLRINRTSDFQT